MFNWQMSDFFYGHMLLFPPFSDFFLDIWYWSSLSDFFWRYDIFPPFFWTYDIGFPLSECLWTYGICCSTFSDFFWRYDTCPPSHFRLFLDIWYLLPPFRFFLEIWYFSSFQNCCGYMIFFTPLRFFSEHWYLSPFGFFVNVWHSFSPAIIFSIELHSL